MATDTFQATCPARLNEQRKECKIIHSSQVGCYCQAPRLASSVRLIPTCAQGIFRKIQKFMSSDALSPVKCDIMVDVIREVLFLPFRARAVRATEGIWEQRRNATKAEVRDDS